MSVSGESAIRVLGPLELEHAGEPVPLPAALPQTMVQLLLLRAGRWCEVEELIDLLWDGRPPRSASANVRGFVCQWRKILRPMAGAAVLEGRRGGYRIVVRQGVLDVHAFETLTAAGARALAAADSPTAIGSYEAALGLWRGTPFDAVTLSGLPERNKLIEQRDQARSCLVTALLATKRPADAIVVLQEAVVAQQYDEGVWARLIATLTLVGRRVAAIEAYRQISDLLRRELGVEPGSELRSAHSRVLLGNH